MEDQALEAGKKNYSRLGAHLIFIDESGFLLTPTMRRTWSPVGQTPLLRHHFANDRISVISGISASPTRCRLGLYGMFFWDNIGQEEVAAFLREVLRHLRGHLIALLDNSNTHRGGAVEQLRRRVHRLHLEYFPAYAPELNPDEGVWPLLKGKLANGQPGDLKELEHHLQREFRAVARSQRKLRGCIQQSELPFHLP
jgi:transposase